MSRTFVHLPNKIFTKWKWLYRKDCVNTKHKYFSKITNRKIRHSLIDEENVHLINAIANYKSYSYLANDKYW